MQPNTPIWQTRKGKIGIGIGFLTGLCVCCMLFAAIAPSTPPTLNEEEVKQTAESFARQSLTQTAQAIPTATATPLPTSTLAPTADIYQIELGERFGTYHNAFTDFQAHQELIQTDITLILDTDWRTRMALYLAVLDLAANDLENIPSAGEKWQTLDAHMKTIASETHLMVENYLKGLDTLEASYIETAANHLNKITEATTLATDEINRINSTP